MPYFLNFFKFSICTAKLLSDSAQFFHASLFTLLALYIVYGFENYDFNSIFGPSKNGQNVPVHTIMVMFPNVIAWFVSIFVYWLVKLLGTWCLCRKTWAKAEYKVKYKFLLTCVNQALAGAAKHTRAPTHVTCIWILKQRRCTHSRLLNLTWPKHAMTPAWFPEGLSFQSFSKWVYKLYANEFTAHWWV